MRPYFSPDKSNVSSSICTSLLLTRQVERLVLDLHQSSHATLARHLGQHQRQCGGQLQYERGVEESWEEAVRVCVNEAKVRCADSEE